MKTKAIVELKTGRISTAAFQYAVGRLIGLGFKVKLENETNKVLLDRISTYADEYERIQKLKSKERVNL